MANANLVPTMLEMNTVQELARKFAIDSVPFEIWRTEDIEPAFARLKSAQADALYVVIDALLNSNRLLIVTSAQQRRCRRSMALAIGSNPEDSCLMDQTFLRFSHVWLR